jgi:hypothetical protein
MRRIVGRHLVVRRCRSDAYAAGPEELVLVDGMCGIGKCVSQSIPSDLKLEDHEQTFGHFIMHPVLLCVGHGLYA